MPIRSSAKPICQACNRPFDPRSPGAARSLGPTCAKRSGDVEDQDSQLAFALPEPPKLVALPRAKIPKSVAQLPAHFKGRYELAKIAFDELFREFCLTNVLLTGERAELAEQELSERQPQVFSLDDPGIDWLEPEHDLALLVDSAEDTVYHRRMFNGVLTLLEITPSRSTAAREHIQTIIKYAEDLAALREAQDAVQLSLL